MKKLKVVLRYVVIFAFGVGVGYFVKSELLVPTSDTDCQWKKLFTEDADHGRIIDLQNALQKPKEAKTTDELSKQLDAQGKIEDLIIKSREAEYAKWTPFTPLFTGSLGVVLGFVAALFGKKSGTSAEVPR